MSSFDEQLALSSPPVPSRSTELDSALFEVVAQAERAVAPRRRLRRRSLIGGLVVVGVIGAGGAAAAGGLVPWFESAPSHGVVTTSSGKTCALTFGVKKLEDPAAPVGAALRTKTVAAAEAYLKDLDYASLRTVAANDMGTVYDEVAHRLDAELTLQGLSTNAVALGMASSCGRDAQ